MTVKPKYYFNLDGNITDGEKEYSLYNIEDVVGGLSISSDLKERYVLYGRNSLLDLLNELNDKCEFLEIENESLEDGATKYAELYHKSLKENEQLKEENEFAKLLANHRGEMVSFANSLIQDIDDELTQKMWYQFKEEMYRKWKKKRGIE